MAYIPHTEKEIKEMLEAIGLKSMDDLFSMIPSEFRLSSPLNLPAPLSEQELLAEMKRLASMNSTVDDKISFLGGGSYNHYIPSVVNHILLRSEFYTSYTPYQPEISQGTLQAIFEYQTLICQLTGMEVANASMYEGGSSTAEAILMSERITGRKRVVVSSALHPEYQEVIRTYLTSQGSTISTVASSENTGTTPLDEIEKVVDGETSCVVIQHPNFLGTLEDVAAISDTAHRNGAMMIAVVTEPISLGLLKPPGEMGADIVAGEGQSLGNSLSFGGPYLGFFATRERYMRQMPGRLVGKTKEIEGRDGYILTLSTREQHIRRDKATSNICTNEGLCALAATVYMTALGKRGLMELARLNLSKAEYLKKELKEIKGVRLPFASPTFNEFIVEIDGDPDRLLQNLSDGGIWGGISLRRYYPDMDRHLLICVTEMNSKEEMDRLIEEFRKLLKK